MLRRKITLCRFDDMHCHFRDETLLKEVLPFTAKYCGRAIAMPNTRPRAILNAKDVIWYRDKIKMVLDKIPKMSFFKPLMTIEIRDNTTPQMIVDAHRVGAVAGKIYPLGVTTNSDQGLREFFSNGIKETFRTMQDVGMICLIHGELDSPRKLFIEREEAFLPIFLQLVENFPNLKTVLEHVSTEKGINMVAQLGNNIAGSITAHHPILTLNDSRLNPNNICNPSPNRFEDRDAVLKAMTSGSPKFFLGSDSAPHLREQKECANIHCGVFTAPILPSLLCEIFEIAGCLDKLENFTSRFGAEFYRLPPNKGKIDLIKKEWTVPSQYGSVVPFMAGAKLQWQLM
ncbi:MAG: hypothetical protein A3C58_02215 [Candidatus Staskawiczbacteria bacterium RIFCSPHIGHO2_02_FULL_34_10]|uniref:Dihydroorotase n=1 Tax=Candidatus Staskawiczbacteria bacterium RIFCSPHIGHO2_02_FULL_34_10 TaxID=1802205 RepID=A0A1G2HYA8_9BACT|nr:MAG: hypothetical protein A3C58_02215 [Candidatus Staskawiczbacteria bacterium RIFCSPHIGHO2_02_FULL_34_10]